ncbi:hybrid sensor histidine kinase/response regulator [Chamaesiphon minutus]|uniref:hybrid sensor histidine kinase/response regulator n=1 Tax=Chamaesiphon minutus TaxID=1173032 RepID=UPI0002DF9F8E|nr:hybrid sensor histidine kinase/response regulator [Chamaesiphon minutus]
MTTDDLDFQESLDRYFEIEAAELLQTIEQTLLSLVQEKTIERVHTLMRAAHTIKGSAANCGFKTIETIAHHLEDVFQALYPPELEIDPELGLLLMEGYDCLYDPLSALLAGVPYDEAATLERTAALFARLQTHLGDFFGRETPLPTAAELGFDVIGSIFTDSIPQDLEDLSIAIASQNVGRVKESLNSLAEFLLELGGSYSLPGIAAIAKTTLAAVERHPGRVLELAPIALANFQQAQIAIVGGDRSVGGEVSFELAAWGDSQTLTTAPATDESSSAEWLSLVDNDTTTAKAPTAESNASEWLSLVDNDTTTAATTTSDAAASEWLSLVDNDTTTAETTTAESNASEWLSLVDNDTTTVATTTSDAAASEWLSLVDRDTTPAETTTVESNASEWLSLVDNDITPAETTTTSDVAASEWLSLVDNDTTPEIYDEPQEHARLHQIVDADLEIVEIGAFEPDRTEYLIEATDSSQLAHISTPNSQLALTTQSGIDRIFQSIWLGQLEATAEDLNPPAPERMVPEREAAPDALVSVRVATVQLERLSHAIGELTIDDNQQFLRAEQLQRLAQSTVEQYRRCEQKLRLVSDWADKNAAIDERQKLASRRKQSTKNKTKKGKKAANEIVAHFDSLELDVYSDLSISIQNLTDELAELGLKVGNLAEMTQRARMTLGKRKQILADAQSELFEARMVEIAGVLNRFPRLLQQMVASHRKPAQLQLIGSEVSIDKIIAEKLYDPLLHLVRNAYDHGIESPEIRASQGKAPIGQLTIQVYHQGNRTKIEVSDDGQGLNWDKIRQRAIDMHLLQASHAATEAELAEIMFAPGFSTADKVNDLSGRGIGLDVVRDRIGALQGTIDVRSVAGQGTTFVMQFPLNLTTTRLMICESQGFVHALRADAISQVLLPSPDRIVSQSLLSDKDSSTFLRWGEGAEQKLIPIYAVNSLLDYRCQIVAGDLSASTLFPIQSKHSTNALLLLEINDDRICLEVSRILMEQELVVKSLGQTFELPNYIQGYSVLGDGSLTLALDPVELIARVKASNNPVTQSIPAKLPTLPATTQPALAPASDVPLPEEVASTLGDLNSHNAASTGRQLQVLVVDDSLVQRQSLARSLTKAGCQVIQASHGREGILRLQEHPRIRLVVCDIEMPQMNGFEFLSYCRQDPKFSQIPIVMLTTRGGQKHRDLAMTLGAKDYLTKPQSDRDLLDIIATLAQPSEVGV